MPHRVLTAGAAFAEADRYAELPELPESCPRLGVRFPWLDASSGLRIEILDS